MDSSIEALWPWLLRNLMLLFSEYEYQTVMSFRSPSPLIVRLKMEQNFLVQVPNRLVKAWTSRTAPEAENLRLHVRLIALMLGRDETLRSKIEYPTTHILSQF